MGIFFDLFVNSISCVFYGFIITIAIIVGVCLLISSLKRGVLGSISFLLSIALLFIVLFINMSIMVGAIKIKKVANNALTVIEQFQDVIRNTNLNDLGESVTNGDYMGAVQQVEQASDIIDIHKIQELKNQLGDNWDLLRLYFESYDMNSAMLFLSPAKTIARFNSKMNGIILKTALWSIAFIILSITIGLLHNNARTSRPQRSSSAHTSTRGINNNLNRNRYGKSHFNRNRRNRI